MLIGGEYLNADVKLKLSLKKEPHRCIDYSQGYNRCEEQCEKCKKL